MYTKEQLIADLEKIPLTDSRVVLVHSSYNSLGAEPGMKPPADDVIEALLDWVGPEGTILFPAFNFTSWTEEHYWDLEETPSQCGYLSEVARKRPDAKRTRHPIYSFIILGNWRPFTKTHCIEAFSPDGIFGRIHQLNGTILSIGVRPEDSWSFQHYVELMAGDAC